MWNLVFVLVLVLWKVFCEFVRICKPLYENKFFLEVISLDLFEMLNRSATKYIKPTS
ncbi:hypothetical protein HanXRQr2_Chr05g0233571 [Helianthus annuus]|uniref:Uncharacterized protein n=1 Tax=Helianthus annuus TaxID=4232 RepID=A0A9K3NNN7_HELAN|nr:hypothetical protein HanXRQr2_Chr05g0233571 [Helianthus annuus]KAJ0571516.1 hypothetical protein HanHA300_Chr05g0191061 [Helianthus annuus]KAJ0585922.1 hypothetical protein HanHA89_Chr05g0206201 [Helianthus annuus]KAJ0748394.1 hypothetical protein HanOQP8_Chr05g0200711 [Helianthus annuus]